MKGPARLRRFCEAARRACAGRGARGRCGCCSLQRPCRRRVLRPRHLRPPLVAARQRPRAHRQRRRRTRRLPRRRFLHPRLPARKSTPPLFALRDAAKNLTAAANDLLEACNRMRTHVQQQRAAGLKLLRLRPQWTLRPRPPSALSALYGGHPPAPPPPHARSGSRRGGAGADRRQGGAVPSRRRVSKNSAPRCLQLSSRYPPPLVQPRALARRNRSAARPPPTRVVSIRRLSRGLFLAAHAHCAAPRRCSGGGGRHLRRRRVFRWRVLFSALRAEARAKGQRGRAAHKFRDAVRPKPPCARRREGWRGVGPRRGALHD